MYNSECGDAEDIEEGEEYIYQEESNVEPGTPNSQCSDLLEHSADNTTTDWDSFPCQHCERHFTSRQVLERHMHIHTVVNNEAHTHESNKGNIFLDLNLGQQQQEKVNPLNLVGSVAQRHTSSPTGSDTSSFSAGDDIALPDNQGVLHGHHACEYCEKRFTTQTSKQQHERRSHSQHLQLSHGREDEPPPEENPQKSVIATSQQESEHGGDTEPAAVQHEEERLEQYMLDVSSSISENLSFYIDGKIVSTSTVSGCEVSEVHSGSSTLIGLDSLILDPAHISQVLNADSTLGKETPGQALAKRRTATPPLLPQIKTELESEAVVSTSSSSLVSSLIENLLPPSVEAPGVQKKRTKLFLSPKLKHLLEKQDGLKPAPVSLSSLPAGTGRFKRRTGSPQSSPQPNSISSELTPDTGGALSPGRMDTQPHSPVYPTENESNHTSQFVDEPVTTLTGGNSCNQQPLDLSSAVRRSEDEVSADSALDLSLQKRESELTSNSVLQAQENSDMCLVEKAVLDLGKRDVSLGNPLDFTVLTDPDVLDPVAEGLIYGLALPSGSLAPAPPSLAPVALQPAPPCTIAFTSPASHPILPAAPSLFTLLAPPPPVPNPSGQPIQVLTPNISPGPLVICTENALNSTECDLSTAFATANAASLVALAQPLDPTVNLPGHVFVTDQIALNPPMLQSASVSEVPFPPAINLNNPLINSYNITSNTVLIECTLTLETPGGVVPAAVAVSDTTEAPAQMVVNHIEQQQIVSVPNPTAEDPALLMSSVAESVTMSTTTSIISDCSAVGEPSPDPEHVVQAEPTISVEEKLADVSVSADESPARSTSPFEDAEESPDSPSEAPEQSFTKNFICNVCDVLFHSMKELGHHVGDHADEWPYKCEFCVLLFNKPTALLDHRSSLHGVDKTYVCSACAKDFVYLCNLKQHQGELHPGQQCTYTEEEKGKLRPQNYNNATKAGTEPPAPDEPKKPVKKEETEVDVAAEELFTTIKILASDGSKLKGPDVRLGINQHYPSFKPPPFPYHNRSPAGSLASATNFTTHNIPQTFSTAIRCTKCGKSFDNMPELHKHILACANASDKRRYTPKKNPIPLRHFAKSQNGVLSTTNSTNDFNESERNRQSNRTKPAEEAIANVKLKVLSKRKKKLVQRVMPPRNKSPHKVSPSQAGDQQEAFVCPHCSREFTMRRSRTKHMAVCPKKPKEVKKRKDGGISVAKENDGQLHRGGSHVEGNCGSPHHRTRLQTSALTKRPAILPVETIFSNKRSKIIIKECVQPKNEAPGLNEPPLVRTFSPSMRQYTRVQHGVKGIPIKITLVKPQRTEPPADELPPAPMREDASGPVASSSEQSATA